MNREAEETEAAIQGDDEVSLNDEIGTKSEIVDEEEAEVLKARLLNDPRLKDYQSRNKSELELREDYESACSLDNLYSKMTQK